MAIHSFMPHAYTFSHMHLSLSFFVPSLFINIALSTSVLSQIFLRYPLFILSCACLSPYLSFYIPFPCSHPCHTISLTSPLYNPLLSLSDLVTFVCFSLFSSCFHPIMEPQQQQQQNQQAPNEDCGGGSGKGSFLCRQSSTRWTPTTDQIRILKDLYYNNGVRSPSADQIQRISARLRQYGKIEGKNVFYWFQNHKARERQKKRFTSTPDILPMQTPILANATRKPDDSLHNHKYPTITPGYAPSSPPSTGVLTVGQIGHNGYGSMTMEKSFRDCSISACGSSSGGASHNFGWVGMDPAYTTSSYAFFDKKKLFGEEQEGDEEEEEEEGAAVAPHIETLPLFPVHGEGINAFCSNMKPQSADSCYSSWYRSDDGYTASRASLELSLNSYNARSQDSI